MTGIPEPAIQSCNTGWPVSVSVPVFWQLSIDHNINVQYFKFITKSSHGLCLNDVKSEHQKIVDAAYESLHVYCFASGKTWCFR